MKTGRNDPCHCGSEKKYKKCCLKKDQENAEKSFEQQEKDLAAKKAANAEAAAKFPQNKQDLLTGKPEQNQVLEKGKQSQVVKKPMGRVSRRDNKSS